MALGSGGGGSAGAASQSSSDEVREGDWLDLEHGARGSEALKTRGRYNHDKLLVSTIYERRGEISLLAPSIMSKSNSCMQTGDSEPCVELFFASQSILTNPLPTPQKCQTCDILGANATSFQATPLIRGAPQKNTINLIRFLPFHDDSLEQKSSLQEPSSKDIYPVRLRYFERVNCTC